MEFSIGMLKSASHSCQYSEHIQQVNYRNGMVGRYAKTIER
ncbi:hypothetical protein TPHV1_510027 [Treponema phagedenis]|uniref:Uncharacterized protein n=1 Tax=Treponema phagedenis TaxID=162 RepID=A0A0B7H151_TREPH|nr:hypothetical protein TPHV1_510027 [Treponema phagedenis]